MRRDIPSLLAHLLFAWLATSTAFAETLIARVVHVSDGDTIRVLDANFRQEKIRLQGIDAPETGQAFGRASKQSMASLLAGAKVRIEWDKRDRYGRIVGRVFVEDVDASFAQIVVGLAWVYDKYITENPSEIQRAYRDAEKHAQQERRGLWMDDSPVPPWTWRELQRTTRPRVQAMTKSPD